MRPLARNNLLKSVLHAPSMSRVMGCNVSSDTWPQEQPHMPSSATGMGLLYQCRQLEKPRVPVNLEKFVALSDSFPVKFGVDTCRVREQPVGRFANILEQVASAYPVIHERTLLLYISFLEHKLKFGNSRERAVYQGMSLVEFVQRLLSKRCVCFFGGGDYYRLLNGSVGYEGFESVGTALEVPPLLLADVLSYDEIKLAALLYVSTHSEFINNGRRSNAGEVTQNKASIEREGVIMGLIGARFERPNVMEYQDIIISPTQNIEANGYGFHTSETATRASDYRRLWCEFYDEPRDFKYTEAAVDGDRFLRAGPGGLIFDNLFMKKRFAISFDTLLLEAEARGVAAGKPAYIHVVGIGLGVWKIIEKQEELFLEAFEERLLALGERLSHIGVVHFSWFHLKRVRSLHDGATMPLTGIRIRISSRNPADKLDEDMLPVVTYAWNGNALPGNDFWDGALLSTSDPAAACSTLIAELQNPHINVDYMSGQNLHIASIEHGLLHIGEYALRVTGTTDV
ncbi:uncharacterized protein LOC111070687 [Drosophila obscura]|uniref:uncharacterized protein LOC111070687 n=1 Tax=Drosophila obscura TaxID=7282 RepID=UPI001BB19D78|nr:uncharacterized protein LOC111070687 [Drosophila obscura]